ncbi:hypothetical protein ZWY2020_040305 [Hordeum vulgare]|nr:hypothetical protein ZWY2020_040305 [Hordeum vulgare]
MLAAPVAALLAYGVSVGNNGSRTVSLRALGVPVCGDFGDLASAAANGTPPFNAMAARCVTFAVDSGKAVATHAMASATACVVTGMGHYGVAVRLQPPRPPPPPPAVVGVDGGGWPGRGGGGEFPGGHRGRRGAVEQEAQEGGHGYAGVVEEPGG